MGNPRKEFELALMVERVVRRASDADQELEKVVSFLEKERQALKDAHAPTEVVPGLIQQLKEHEHRTALALRVAARRKRIPSMEEQLERLNAPRGPKKLLKPQRIFGCDVVEVGGEFVVYKNGVEVGRAKDRRGAQEVARANW